MSFESDLTLNHSNVYGYNDASGGNGVGIEVDNGANTSINAVNSSLVQGHSIYGDGIGLKVAANDLGNAQVGDLSGDGTSRFIGEVGNSLGTGAGVAYGLYAASNDAASNSSPTTSIGNITGLSFYGLNTTGNAYGLYAVSSGLVSASSLIGTINNSTFYAASDVTNNAPVPTNAYGLYVTSSSKAGAATTSIAGIENNSAFSGYGSIEGYGLYASSYAKLGGNSTTKIPGGIAYSSFTGSATGNSIGKIAAGLFAASTSNLKDTTASVSVGNIDSSAFTGTSDTGAAYGLDANSANVNQGNSDITFADIEGGSKFTGTSTAGYTASGFYLFGASSSGNNNSAVNVTIQSISYSTFTGTTQGSNKENDASGFLIALYSLSASTKITGGVSESTFNAHATGTSGRAASFMINDKIEYRGTIKVGGFTNNKFFTYNTDSTNPLYLSSGMLLQANNITIADRRYVISNLATVKVYANAEYNDLLNTSNSFTLADTKWPGVKGSYCVYDLLGNIICGG